MILNNFRINYCLCNNWYHSIGSLAYSQINIRFGAWINNYIQLTLWDTESFMPLTHWGRVTHICVGKLIIIGSDDGLSPDRRQAIIWTNAELLSAGPLRTYFSENLIEMQQFSLKKMHVKMSSAKWRLSCLGLNGLIQWRFNEIAIENKSWMSYYIPQKSGRTIIYVHTVIGWMYPTWSYLINAISPDELCQKKTPCCLKDMFAVKLRRK